METKWFVTQQSNDPIKRTNVPYGCFSKGSSRKARFAIPFSIGSKDWSGTAHYRERVAPEHGSGMYFNAFCNLAFSAPQATRPLDGYDSDGCVQGNFFVASQRTIVIFILDGIHMFHTNLNIEWHGDLVKVKDQDWVSCDYSCVGEYSSTQGALFIKETPYLRIRNCPAMAPEGVGAWVYSLWVSVGSLSSPWVAQSWSRFDSTHYAPVPTPDDLNSPRYFNWKDKEYWAFQWIKEVGIVLPPYGSMVSQAYTEAIATFPSVQSNTLANILEVIELARSILSGDFGRTLKETKNARAMKDAWLAYRYSYTTSKLDFDELKAFVDRVGSLPVGEITLRSKITFSHTTVRCSVVLPMSDITGKLEGIESLGLKLSAANAWDLIPYSFVVDWFMRISDWLNYFETQGFSLTLHPRQVWYSITTVYEGQTTYFRWSGSPALGLPFDLYAPVSGKTVAMRIGDVIALS